LGLKITAIDSLFGPQNQSDIALSVVPQNQWEDEDGVGEDQVEDGRADAMRCIGLCYPYFAVFLYYALKVY
jgi:hypothetical protein